MSDKTKNILEKIITVLLLVMCFVIMGIYGWANIGHYKAYMESDIASETLLTEVYYKGGFVQPDTWVISTARRTISAPKLGAFLYPLTGGDVCLSLGLACTIMMVMMVAAMIFFYRQIGFSFIECLIAVLLALVLSKPANEPQRMLYLYASYYVSHFITMFLLLGLYTMALKRKKIFWQAFVIMIPLSVLNGFQGMHASMFFYMPLLGTEILRRLYLWVKKEKESWGITAWVTMITVFAFAGTKLFSSYAGGNSRNIRHAPEKFFGYVLPYMKEVLNLDRLELLVAIFCVLAIIGYIWIMIDLKWSALPIIFGVVVTILATTFSTAETAPRYYLMLLFVVGTGVAYFVHRLRVKGLSITAGAVKDKLAIAAETLVAAGVVIFAVSSAGAFYQGLIVNDHIMDSTNGKVATWMLDNGYEYGYAVFENANAITVLGDNRIKVRGVNSMYELHGIKWLSDKTWYPPIKSAEGATVYVASPSAYEDFNKFLSEEKPQILDTVQIDDYVLYVLDRDYTVWVD